ncbi:MAG: hypothetical protein RIB58_13505 [Phycisphaerales bacterium]|jgi:hypothetical protein
MSTDPSMLNEGASEAIEHVEVSGPDPRKRLTMQVGVVAGVLALAGGVIYWMHHKGISPGKNLKPVEMRYTIEQTQARHYEGEERILRSLALAGPPPQVPLEDIEENPFRLERTPAPELDELPSQPTAPRDPTLIRAEQILGSLKIEMVLNSETNPLARINGTVYRVGDKIDGVVEIVGITGRSVTFRAKTLLRTIEMEAKR